MTLGFTSDIKNLVPMFGVFKPTLVVSVPRVFEKVYNTAEQNARDDGKGRIFEIAVKTAIEWSQAQDERRSRVWLLRAKHALFDRLVYGKLRAALGGDCHAAISGGAPLGARLGHFYRGVGLTIYEGYGLTETSAAITVNRIDEPEGRLRRKAVAGQQHAHRRRRRTAGPRRRGVRGYWHNEKETDEVFSDGWFHTGDLGAHRRRRLPVDHRPQEGDHRHRGRQERRPRRPRGPAAGAPADQPGDGRRRRASRSSPR